MKYSDQQRMKAWDMVRRLTRTTGRTPEEKDAYIEKAIELALRYDFYVVREWVGVEGLGRVMQTHISRDAPTKYETPPPTFVFNSSKGLDLTDPTWSNLGEADGFDPASPAEQARWVAEHYGKKK